jgi:hypothetical protein
LNVRMPSQNWKWNSQTKLHWNWKEEK